METFGAYVRMKRKERDMTLREFARKTDISPVYMSMLETDQKQAPAADVLERFANALCLNQTERDKLLDLAAKSKNTPAVPVDLPEYINERDIVRLALRTAKDVDATDEEWQEFIERITKRGRESGSQKEGDRK